MAKRKSYIGRRRRRYGKRYNQLASKIPRNPFGGNLYPAKIESVVDVFVYMSGTLGYYSLVQTAYSNVGQVFNQYITSFAKDIVNLYNSYAFWSMNGVTINFDRNINLNDSRIQRLPPLYLDLLGSMTTTQGNNVVARTVAESDTALKINVMDDSKKSCSKYYKFTGNYTTIGGTQAFGKGNYMTTDYFPVMNILLGQMDQPGATESIKIGQIRCTWYVTFTKRIAINNFVL